MPFFKDKLSGCVVEFTMEHDVKAMRSHPEYDEVFPDEPKSVEPPKPAVKKAYKED